MKHKKLKDYRISPKGMAEEVKREIIDNLKNKNKEVKQWSKKHTYIKDLVEIVEK